MIDHRFAIESSSLDHVAYKTRMYSVLDAFVPFHAFCLTSEYSSHLYWGKTTSYVQKASVEAY